MRNTRLLPLLVALAIAATALPDPAAADDLASLDDLSWMAGSWAARHGDLIMEESWSAPRGGMMLGTHRDTREGKRAFFEYLRIEVTEGGIVYLASPLGRPATAFPLVELGDRRVVFENPEHDFPQRIVYALDGTDVLVARAESITDESARPQEWRWRRLRGDGNDVGQLPD